MSIKEMKMEEIKFKTKEYYREKIVEMVNKISNSDIIYCIYVFISDILKEDKEA